jgi:hypothetical protein
MDSRNNFDYRDIDRKKWLEEWPACFLGIVLLFKMYEYLLKHFLQHTIVNWFRISIRIKFSWENNQSPTFITRIVDDNVLNVAEFQ